MPRLDARGAQNVVNLAALGGLEVAWGRPHLEVAAHAALGVAPERARVHHLFAEHCLPKSNQHC